MLHNLVTGGSGFLGSHLADALLKRGEKVRALIRPTSNLAHLQNIDVELVYGDLDDIQSLQKAATGIHRIYHCAALAADWGSWKNFRTANVSGVGNILKAAVGAAVDKFIHISTADVYGHPDYPASETAPYRLRGWPYGDTKPKMLLARFISALLIYFTLLHMAGAPFPRYAVPLRPLLYAMAMFTLSYCVDMIRNRIRSAPENGAIDDERSK